MLFLFLLSIPFVQVLFIRYTSGNYLTTISPIKSKLNLILFFKHCTKYLHKSLFVYLSRSWWFIVYICFCNVLRCLLNTVFTELFWLWKVYIKPFFTTTVLSY